MVCKNKLGFMLDKLIMETIYLLRCLMGNVEDKLKNIAYGIYRLEKAYDKVAREVL